MSRTRPATTAALALALAVVAGSPASAQMGFFDQLFGVAPSYAPPAYYPPAAQPYYAPAPREYRRPKKRVAESKPVRQKTTDLMHDASLRPGDAVMMKDGIHVFEGDRDPHHTKSDFVALDHSDAINKTQRIALAAADTSRHDPLRGDVQVDTLASGRSAAVGAPVSSGYKIVDARGKSIRYVGP